jgi:rhamnosyltransferase
MIQRAVWEKIPFNDMALIGEDQEWSKAALQAGYTIIYEPASLVYHSHNYSLKARLRRSFDSGASTITWETNSLFHWYMIPFHVFSNCAGAFLFMHGKSGCLKWTFKAMIASLVTDTGLLLGINHKRLPHNLVRRLTSIPHSPVFQRKGG